MLLLSRWWGQLQAKASNPDTAPLLEDESAALHTSQYNFVSSTEHHSRHHPPSYPNDAQGEVGLIEQQGSEEYPGSDSSKASSRNRGVLPGLFQRRRPLPAPLMSLHGQSHPSRMMTLMQMPQTQHVTVDCYQMLSSDGVAHVINSFASMRAIFGVSHAANCRGNCKHYSADELIAITKKLLPCFSLDSTSMSSRRQAAFRNYSAYRCSMAVPLHVTAIL